MTYINKILRHNIGPATYLKIIIVVAREKPLYAYSGSLKLQKNRVLYNIPITGIHRNGKLLTRI